MAFAKIGRGLLVAGVLALSAHRVGAAPQNLTQICVAERAAADREIVDTIKELERANRETYPVPQSFASYSDSKLRESLMGLIRRGKPNATDAEISRTLENPTALREFAQHALVMAKDVFSENNRGYVLASTWVYHGCLALAEAATIDRRSTPPPAPAQGTLPAGAGRPNTGAPAAPAAKTEDLYWIGIKLTTPDFVCERYYCKPENFKIRVVLDYPYGTRFINASAKSIDYIDLGQPFPEGTHYTAFIDRDPPERTYHCEPRIQSGVVPPESSSRNSNLTNRLIKIVCEPTGQLLKDVEEARLERERSDNPNLDDLLTGCPAELEAAITDRMARGGLIREVAAAYFTGSAEALVGTRDPIILRRLLSKAGTDSVPPSLNRLDRCMLTRRLAQLGAPIAPPPAAVVPPVRPPVVHIPVTAVSPLLGSCSSQLDAAVNAGIAAGTTKDALLADFELTARALAHLETSLLLPGMLAAEARIGGAENRLNTCMMKLRLAELDGSAPASPVQTTGPTTTVPYTPPVSRPTPPVTPARPSGGAGTSPNSPSKPPATGAVPPVRIPTQTPANGHNDAHEATDCVQLIDRKEFAAYGVKSIMGAVLRNTCAFPIDVVWCVDCHRGYDNLSAVKARADGPISVPTDRHYDVKWAACQAGVDLGFNNYQNRLSPDLKHSCR